MGQLKPPATVTIPVTKVPALDTVDRYAVSHSGRFHTCSEVVELPCSSATPLPAEIIQAYADFILQFTGLEEVAFLVTQPSHSPQGSITTTVHAIYQHAGEPLARAAPTSTWKQHEHHNVKKGDIQFYLQLDEPENGTRQLDGQADEVSVVRFTLYIE